MRTRPRSSPRSGACWGDGTLSDELIDKVSLVGPKEKVRDQLQVFREAGVHTVGVTPLAFDKEGRLEQLRLVAEMNAA